MGCEIGEEIAVDFGADEVARLKYKVGVCKKLREEEEEGRAGICF